MCKAQIIVGTNRMALRRRRGSFLPSIHIIAKQTRNINSLKTRVSLIQGKRRGTGEGKDW